jgi:3-hydroxyacyl-CoA dehydrogenase
MSFSSVSIVGAGPVSGAIAVAIARIGTPVTIVRAAHGDLGRVLLRIDRRLGWEVDAGTLTPAEREVVRARIDVATDLGAIASSDLVIESTAGDARSRRALLATIEGSLSGGSVLAANASAHHLPALAEVLRRRDQFVGMRFFQPATASSLVELSLLADTAPGVSAACRTFSSWLSKDLVVRAESEPRIGYREYLLGSA